MTRPVSKLERYTGVAPSAPGGERTVSLHVPRRKPVVASAEEIECNPRSRSAKYRCAEKIKTAM